MSVLKLASYQVFSSPLTDEQIDAIMEALDTDGDGTLTYTEFLNGFSIVDTAKQQVEPERST